MDTYCYGPDQPVGSPCKMELAFAEEIRPVMGGGNISSSEISIIKVLDKAEYDALEIKDPKTLYMIRG